MGERLFDTVFVAGRRRQRARFSLPVSIAVHAAGIAGVLALSLTATAPLAPTLLPPLPPIAIARADPPPPAQQPPPGPPRASRAAPPAHTPALAPVPPPIRVDEPSVIDNDVLPPDLGESPGVREPGPPTGNGVVGIGDGPADGGPPDGGGTGTTPVRVGYLVQEPRKIRHVEPVYPDLARMAGISAVVEMECVITVEGRVTDVRVLRGNPLFNANAVRAVQQWLYTPTNLNGRLVPVILTVRITFKLH